MLTKIRLRKLSQNLYDIVGKTPLDVELENGLSENSLSQDPNLSFLTPSTSLFRKLRESPQSPRERCATVQTSCAPQQEIIFGCEFAMSSQNEIVDETEI